MSVTARPYVNDFDLRAMQVLAQEHWRRRGVLAGHHVGDLAWARFQHAGREGEWRIQLWEDGSSVVAWGWIQLPARLAFLVHPDRPELLEGVLDWFDGAAQGSELTVSALLEDDEATAALEGRGFAADAEAPWFALTTRALDEIPRPVVRPGYALRTVESDDLQRRVAVHRAAWEPSRVTAESYANVMRAWPYRAELDCVVEAPDGSFAAYALGWLDDVNRVGELEPVGTDPRHARLGLARAVCLFALQQLRAAGAETALVLARGDDAYPAPKRLYESIGFRQVAQSLEFRLRR